MNNKRLIVWAAGLLLTVLTLIMIILLHEPEKNGISRALAAKAAVLSMTSRSDCEAADGEGQSHFPELEQGIWYVKYMDYLYDRGMMSEELTIPEDQYATQEITYGEVEFLAKAFSEELAGQVGATKRNREKACSQEDWWEFYEKLLAVTDPEGEVQETRLLLYGTPLNVENSNSWVAYTSEGQLGFEGLSLDSYIDRELLILVRSGEIVTVREVVSDEVVYQNVWITGVEEDSFVTQLGDMKRRMELPSSMAGTEGLENQIADLHMKKGKLEKLSLKKDRINGKVLAVRDEGIEIEGYGLVPFDEEFQVYQTYGNSRRRSLSAILVGYDLQEFAVEDGKLCAALILSTFDAKTIRVLIKDTNFTALFHQQVTVTGTTAVNVTYADQEKMTLAAGESLTFSDGDRQLAAGRVILEPQDGGELLVSTVERSMGVPSYPGRLEISQEEEGLALVNELYLEDYLTRVVPSEMPASYEREALKVQAVCARTYAYRQIQANGYSRYGAHVDDSITYQVYNNISTDSRTDQAVQETSGQILTYRGSAIEALYFSTSCGATTDGSIWGNDASQTPYLRSVLLRDDDTTLDLTDEDTFSEFIKNKTYRTYDSSFAFYRWQVRTDSEILRAEITGIGEIRDIAITERGEGGIARKMTVTGTEGTREITGQNPIRAALGDPSLTIRKNDGTTVTGWSSLPSSFLVIEKGKTDENGVTSFSIYGGGYGHGAGMSQNGAHAMAKAGWSCEQILKFFYQDVEIETVY